MTDISLKLAVREAQGKRVKHVRNDDMIPSVVYGGGSKPVSTMSPVVETTKVVRQAGKHTPVHVLLDGKTRLAIIKSVDIDPARHTIRHVAFQAIRQNEKIVTEVPIRLVGMSESPAERAGLVILQALEKVEVRATAAHLPESFELSVENLSTTDDKITLADIVLPQGVEFADVEQDMDLVVANVYEPSALQAANEASGGDAESATPEEVASEATGDKETA